jgi:dTDP-4-dehydrorhamnose 3,5-epimerase
MKLDHTLDAAKKDVLTAKKDGTRVEKNLDGVIVVKPVVHSDHRGRVFEVWQGEENDFWKDPVVYCYTFTIRKDHTKGWGLHENKIDRYTLISGEMTTILYDARLDSPTYGQHQVVILSEQGNRQLSIPKGVWHMNINSSETETFLINHPTDVYHHDTPDRWLLPLDSDLIPVDVKEYFPKQYGA